MGNKRINVKAILADGDLRRKLMVSTIQATQSREGIDTTPEQAHRAYYVVSEGERAGFFALERFKGGKKADPDRRHEMFVKSLRGEVQVLRFDVARRDFGTIDGSPLAYERVAFIAPIFRESPPLDPAFAIVAQGLATAADEHFVRCFWEIPGNSQGQGKAWVPFAKGGDFCRFYADIFLRAYWKENGTGIRTFEGAYIRNEQHYFKPGLTWPRRTQKGFNLRMLPPGCIFADKGPAIFPYEKSNRFYLLGVMSSAIVEYILQGLTSFGWEVGAIQRLPIPRTPAMHNEKISFIAESIYNAKREWDSGNEVSTSFDCPWLLRFPDAPSLSSALDSVAACEAEGEAAIQSLYDSLNDEAYRLYGIPDATRKIIEASLGDRPPEILWPQMEGRSVDQKRMEHVSRLLSYAVKRVLEGDEDGIVPFGAVNGKPRLVEHLRLELASLFPGRDANQIEVEIVNELKRTVKGYRRPARASKPGSIRSSSTITVDSIKIGPSFGT